jgi:hypothetical protein
MYSCSLLVNSCLGASFDPGILYMLRILSVAHQLVGLRLGLVSPDPIHDLTLGGVALLLPKDSSQLYDVPPHPIWLAWPPCIHQCAL